MQLNGHRSGWTEVRSGTMSFYNFIDYIDGEVLLEISKFTDNTKIASRVNTLNDIISMQRTLDKLVAWVNRWNMEFSVNKCGEMHIGKINLELQYQMNDDWVKSVGEEKDLGVIM